MDLKNTVWDNSNIYKNFEDANIARDLVNSEIAIATIQTKVTVFATALKTLETESIESLKPTLPLARELMRLKMDQQITLGTLMVFAKSKLSTDSQSKVAKNLESKASQLLTQLTQAINSLDLFLLRAPDAYVTEFLNEPSVHEMTFSLSHQRHRNDFLLTPETEAVLIGHGLDGLHAWGKLYTEMASSIQVDVAGLGRMGLAKASGLLFQGDRLVRENAHRAINAGWRLFQVPTAAVLNAIYGWRIENYKTRSSKRELNYLDVTCHSERITHQTLKTLMDVTFEKRSLGHRSLKLMSHEMNLPSIAAWDILAPFPEKLVAAKPIPLSEAIDLIAAAFGEFSQDMGQFAKMAYEKNWIDGQPTEYRQTGAYCTIFSKQRESRIFMTYTGSVKNVMTLAHELGHAYHNWVMRDLPAFETYYSSSIAETASIFAETLVSAALLRKAATSEEKKKILWQDLESASTFLNNIPARFEFEKNLFERRKEKTLSADELSTMTENAWELWYEDSLSEYNEMFWANKLHFHITRMSFYNYPYLFGYLFSLGIYAQKDKHGDQFEKLYINLLRDSGRMTAEDLIQKHFQQDISKPEFWLNSISIIEKSVLAYEQIVASELNFTEAKESRGDRGASAPGFIG